MTAPGEGTEGDVFSQRNAALFTMQRHEETINDAMLRALGADPEQVDSWPYDDFGFDWYDNSVELYEFTPERRLTPDEVAAICGLGMRVIFVNYKGGGERHYHVGAEGAFFERPDRTRPLEETARSLARERTARLAAEGALTDVLVKHGCGDYLGCTVCPPARGLLRAALNSPEGGTTIACARKGGSGMCVGVVAAHCPDCGGPPLEGGTTEGKG